MKEWRITDEFQLGKMSSRPPCISQSFWQERGKHPGVMQAWRQEGQSGGIPRAWDRRTVGNADLGLKGKLHCRQMQIQVLSPAQVILGTRSLLVWKAGLCTVGCLAEPSVSTFQMPSAASYQLVRMKNVSRHCQNPLWDQIIPCWESLLWYRYSHSHRHWHWHKHRHRHRIKSAM